MSEDTPTDKKFHRLTCSNCRKKKARCDGAYPFCVNCRTAKQKCIYDKPASISYVRHLEKKLELLERKLQSFELEESSSGSTPFFNVHEELSKMNKQPRDHSEGLEFNTHMLTNLMTDLDIKHGPPMISNVPYVPFSYISDTFRFAHFFEGPLHKEPEEKQITGPQLIQLVTSIRQKYSNGDFMESQSIDLIRDYIVTGISVSAHGFPFFRPHYVNKYFRDFQAVLEHCMLTLEVEKSEKHYKSGFNPTEVVASFALASKVFYRAIVSPFVQSSHNRDQDEASKAKVRLYINDTFRMQNQLYEKIGQNLFGEVNPSMAQTCLHASVTEVMLGGSLNTAALLNNLCCRMSIELFEHYTSSQDKASTIWFLRTLWACYIWDKIISSCCNRNPVFPNPPPLSPSDMQFNSMDTLPSIDKEGKVVLEVDGRPAIVASCRLSIVLSDVLLRRHHFTNVRVHLYEVVDEIQSMMPEELTPKFKIPWDRTVHNLDALEVVNLPPNYPVELILPIAVSLLIKLELYCESFVDIAENLDGPHPNTIENKYTVFQGLVKYMKMTTALARIVSDVSPYGEIATSASYVNPWFRLLIMKSLYKVLMNDEAVKLLVIVTGEVPSEELTDGNVRPSYEFVDKSSNVVLDVPKCNNDDSLPAEMFIQNIVFPMNGSSNFALKQTKDRHYYLKYMICMYIAVAQLSVRRLSEFRSPLSQEVLGQSLITRPAIVEVFSEQREYVCKTVRKLPDPKFDEDLNSAYSYSRLLDMVNKLGEFGGTLLRSKKSSSSSESSKSLSSKYDFKERSDSVCSSRQTSSVTPPVNKKRNRHSEFVNSPSFSQSFVPRQANAVTVQQPQLPQETQPPNLQEGVHFMPPPQGLPRQPWTPHLSVHNQQQFSFAEPTGAQIQSQQQHSQSYNEFLQQYLPPEGMYNDPSYSMHIPSNQPMVYSNMPPHFHPEHHISELIQPEFGVQMNYQQQAFQQRENLDQQHYHHQQQQQQQLQQQQNHLQQQQHHQHQQHHHQQHQQHQHQQQQQQQQHQHQHQHQQQQHQMLHQQSHPQQQQPQMTNPNVAQFHPEVFNMFFTSGVTAGSAGVSENYPQALLLLLQGADLESMVNLVEDDNTMGYSNIFGPVIKDDVYPHP